MSNDDESQLKQDRSELRVTAIPENDYKGKIQLHFPGVGDGSGKLGLFSEIAGVL
jgi:hypothetical protein